MFDIGGESRRQNSKQALPTMVSHRGNPRRGCLRVYFCCRPIIRVTWRNDDWLSRFRRFAVWTDDGTIVARPPISPRT